MKRFEVLYLKEVDEFLSTLDRKVVAKIFYNIDLAKENKNNELFKKLTDEIWEFRTLYNGLQIRLLAFWHKENNQETLVIATHGFIKKTDKVPLKEIERALTIKRAFFKT